jgi:choline dehydrogenase-like flavoprotein
MQEAGFDHVVVGNGSAGGLLAARLSARGALVLLLEAGPDHRSAGAPAGVASPNFFRAVAEPGRIWPALTARHAAGQEPAPYIRGRGAGGSSSVNAMVLLRGLPEDYERWAGELGCTGWDAATFAGLFARIESTSGGLLPLERWPAERCSRLDRAVRAAARTLGYAECPDYHLPGAEGAGPAALSTRNGVRVSCNDAYLEPARARSNLVVRGDALVDRLLLDDRRAAGVRLSTGEEIEARSVLLCAGAIHSPAIMLRSGIGAGDGLPVGENLIEHPLVPVGLVLKEDARLGEEPVVTGLIRYTSGLAEAGRADMQLLPLALAGPDPGLAGVGMLGAAAMRVFSRGTVTLHSNDPHDDPVVEFRMLSDERDRIRLLDGLARLRRLVAAPAVAEVIEVALAGEVPLASVTDDDAYLQAAVTNYVHAVGSCRMGAPDDPAAVVDPACRVRGYERLRVIDASVMPDIPRANTHLTVVAIAERAAELLAGE